MKGLILSGGHGTRLRPLTHTGPKQLIPIANKPNILYCLEDIRDSGIIEIGIILGNNMPEKVIELLGDGTNYGVKLTYINQGEPKGIAHAIGCARDFMGSDSFVVYLGDNIFKGGIKTLVSLFENSNAECGLAVCKVTDPRRYGLAELDDTGKIIRAVEKPDNPKSDLAITGVYLFRESVFPIIDKLRPSKRNELEITEAINGLIEKNYEILVYTLGGWWKDTGKQEDILEANHLIMQDLKSYNHGTLEDDVEVIGQVGIGKGTIIKSGSKIRGPVVIGEYCEIGPNSYIGPYSAIGDKTVVVGGEIESSIVMGETEINCDKRIVDSLIGKGVHIVSSEGKHPKGLKLLLGENSSLTI